MKGGFLPPLYFTFFSRKKYFIVLRIVIDKLYPAFGGKPYPTSQRCFALSPYSAISQADCFEGLSVARRKRLAPYMPC
jgi:hypothetical protein